MKKYLRWVKEGKSMQSASSKQTPKQLRHQAETFAIIVTSTQHQIFNQQNISPEKTPPPSGSELNEIRTVCLLFLFCFLLSLETPAESSSSNEHRE